MPLYAYQALDASGKKRNGLIEAQGEREAKEKLREQGLMVAKISIKASISSRQNLKGDALLAFTIQLAQLIDSGIPLYESLIAVEEQSRTEPYHRIILSLCDQVKAGTPLSQAMATYPESFNKLYVSMITAGETVGALNIVLEKLGQLLSKQHKMKRQIGTAMIYPAVLATFSLLIIGMLLGFVVPSIEGIFADRKLNTLTQLVLNTSHFARDWWWIYIPIFFGLLAFIVIKLRSPAGKLWRERNFLKAPLIRTLMIQASVARFSRTMGTLQIGGLPMIDSLRIAREVMGNVVLENEIKKAEERIIEGSSLSSELSRSKHIPHLVSRMLSVGEESGSSVVMLNKIADMYEEELEKTIDRVMALAQPVILVIMGVIIGGVLMAILLPLTDVSNLSM